jgi:hypothetical protein
LELLGYVLSEPVLLKRISTGKREADETAADVNGEGCGCAFKKGSLKMALQHIHDHVAQHMGAGFNLRMLYMYFVR